MDKDNGEINQPKNLFLITDTLHSQNNAKLLEIQINERQFREVIADSWTAIHLFNQTSKRIFRRENTLVQIGLDQGTLSIKPFKMDEIYGVLLRIADWVRTCQSSGRMSPARPPKDCARDLLVNADTALPVLETIITTPIFAKNGQVATTPGYYEDLRLYLDNSNGLLIPPIPSTITQNDIEEAKKLILEELLGDFPFVSASDATHTLAALIQPFIRHYYAGCSPLVLIEAPCPGSGKGLLTNIISLIVSGTPVESRTLPHTDDEVRKMLTSELSRGRQLILLDNADVDGRSTKIHSSALASVLTARIWTDRILGESRMISMPNLALWIMTANNPQLTSELARRCIRVRLDPKTEAPWRRRANEFRHPDLDGWVLKNRGRLIHAIFILIQNWIAKGEHRSTENRLGSFEDWSATIGGILSCNEVSGFLENLEALYAASDSETREWQSLVEIWHERLGLSAVRVLHLNALCEEFDLLEVVRGSGNLKSQQTRLGHELMKVQGRIFGKWQIHFARDKKKHGKFYQLISIAEKASHDQMSFENLEHNPNSSPPADSDRDFGTYEHEDNLEDLEPNQEQELQ